MSPRFDHTSDLRDKCYRKSVLHISLNGAHIINREFNSLQEQEIYALQSVQTSSRALATSRSECIGRSFPGCRV